MVIENVAQAMSGRPDLAMKQRARRAPGQLFSHGRTSRSGRKGASAAWWRGPEAPPRGAVVAKARRPGRSSARRPRPSPAPREQFGSCCRRTDMTRTPRSGCDDRVRDVEEAGGRRGSRRRNSKEGTSGRARAAEARRRAEEERTARRGSTRSGTRSRSVWRSEAKTTRAIGAAAPAAARRVCSRSH